ncbi:MAG: leucine-rich repeat domain-containing protein, partial [Clostridia bacterium]|nr:leucine-rich repeat domain-containing protein [Clostridia bacterium]
AGLTTVDIHSDMQEIKSGAFDNLTSLTAINYNAVNCNANEKCIDYKDFVGCGKNVVLNIGADVEVINGGVFSGSNSISKVNFDANCKVNTFGVNAFKGCMNTNLVRFDIPSTVTTLKAGCFADTTSSNEGLTWLIIPTTVTNIENGFATSSSGAKQIFCYIDEEDKPEGWAEKWNLLHERTGETCKVYWNNQWWLNGGVPVALEA